jgi:4-amino-4-deoxy-L-arabinose transferase-like glycosyltransferase
MSSSTLKVLLPALAAAFISWTLSVYIHYPMVQGSIYSDIVSFWHREPGLAAGLKPCIDYFFEYPPAACFITYAARLLGGPDVEGYYMAFVLLSLPAFLLLAYSMHRLAGRVAIALTLSPSLIVYGIYNYDHFLAALMALALALYLSGRRVPPMSC